MKVTLTKVSYSAALSEETAAFSATVCLDGVPSFGVSNHGTGGCNDIFPLKGQTHQEARANEEKLEAYAKTLPEIQSMLKGKDGKTFSYPQSAETMVGDALDEYQRQKQGKRILAKLKDRVVMLEGTRLSTSNKAPAGQLVQWIAHFRMKYPDAIILNCLTPEAAAEIVYNQVLA